MIVAIFCLFCLLGACVAQAQTMEEVSFTVKNGTIELPGTLTKAGDKDKPIVVLVHGSGPQDRDETVGPNKPFKDLAVGLAEYGVSSLRYDKRTMLYKGGADTITFREETIDDAAQAVRQLKSEGYKHVFVAGHSLGGHCTPFIAQSTKGLADGFIILSGNVSTLEDAVKAQLKYIGSQQGLSDAQIQQAVSQQLTALPERYRQFDRDNSPIKLLKEVLIDQPSLRWMVVGGGHDYQVTIVDFSSWQLALMGKATFYFGEKLDHFFRPLESMAKPADYLTEGHMDKDVIKAIAEFVNHK